MRYIEGDITVPTMTPADVQRAFLERRSTAGEFYGSNVALGFENSLPGWVSDYWKMGRPTDLDAEGNRWPTLSKPPLPLFDFAGEPDPNSVGITKEQFDGIRGKREIPFDPFMTEEKAKALVDMHDLRTYRELLIAQRDAGVGEFIAGLGAQMVGSAPDPLNLIPMAGPAWRAAMATKATARAAYILRSAGVAAAQTAAATAIVQPLFMSRDAAIGHPMSLADATLDILFSAALGGTVGAGGAWWSSRAPRRVEAPARETSTPERTDGARPEGSPDAAPGVGEAPPPARATEAVEEGAAGRQTDAAPDVASEAPPAREPAGVEAIDAEIARLAAERTGRQPMPSQETIAQAGKALEAAVADVVEGRAVNVAGVAPEPLTAARPDGLFLVRTQDSSTPDGIRSRDYMLSEVDPAAPPGYRNVATVLTTISGDTARVDGIQSMSAAPNTAESRGTIGRQRLRQIAAAIKADNPEVKWLTGNRVSGIRQGGGFVSAADGVEARVSIDSLLGRRGEAPPKVMDPAEIDGFLKTATPAETPAPAPLSDPSPIAPEPDLAARMEQELAQPDPADSADAASAFPEAAEFERAVAEGRIAPEELAAVEAADEAVAQAGKMAKAYDQAAACILGALG